MLIRRAGFDPDDLDNLNIDEVFKWVCPAG
jgi:hypothetical protein